MNEAFFYNSLNIFAESNYQRLARWKNKFGTWQETWLNVKTDKKNVPDPEKEWREITRLGIRLILNGDGEFSESLKEIPHCPFGIYIRGDSDLVAASGKNKSLVLAMVGTRKATNEGKELARKFSAELTRNNFTIVSGLALGIDAAAHLGCLDACGKTIAVLAGGLDYIYPRTNEGLAKKILSGGGALVSEYPPGTKPLPHRFLERNRIVSGISRGVLIIESPKESGSLVTARFALDQNRDVFVLPGPATHPNFVGSHQLIRQGAELITDTAEILAAFGLEKNDGASAESIETEEEKTICGALRQFSSPVTIDRIAETTNLDISDINRTLTFLTLKNIVKETNDGYALR